MYRFKNEKLRIMKINQSLINDGVLYHKFFIYSENYQFIYDFDTTAINNSNPNYFIFKNNKLIFNHKKVGKIIFEIIKSRNPQNKNNFRVSIKGDTSKLDGLLIKEYFAPSMETIGLKDTHIITGLPGKNIIRSKLYYRKY